MLNLKFGDQINISGWDKEKIQFKAIININGGRLNDALVLDFGKTGEAFTVNADYDKQLIKKGKYDDCPDKYSRYQWEKDDDHYAICSDITYKIYIPKSAEVRVESISGDIMIAELNGAIDAHTISGFIDVTRSAGADLAVSTITGRAYTNLEDLKIKDKQATSWSLNVKGLLNGGGPAVELETISGDIFLREENGKRER